MAKLRKNAVAQTKQMVGQMIGDQQLVQEGVAEQREAKGDEHHASPDPEAGQPRNTSPKQAKPRNGRANQGPSNQSQGPSNKSKA